MIDHQKASKIVDDAIRKTNELAYAIGTNLPTQNKTGFNDLALTLLSESSGNKISLSEESKKEHLNYIEGVIDNKNTAIAQAFNNVGMKYQFADPQGSALNNYTYQLLPMFIIEAGTNLDQTQFALRKYFPQMSMNSYQAQLDRGQGAYGRVNGSDYSNPLPIKNRMQTYNEIYTALNYSEEVRIDPRDMLFTREKGSQNTSNGVAGLQQALAYETLYATVRQNVGMNLDLADAVLRGGYNYPTGSTNDISSGIPSANTFTFPAPLGTYNTTTGQITPNNNIDPISILAAMMTSFPALVRSNKMVRGILNHPIVQTMFRMNSYVQAWLKQGFITRTGDPLLQEIMDTLMIENLRLQLNSDLTSWNPVATNQATDNFAINQYVLGGNAVANGLITNAALKGFIEVDTSMQGGKLGAILIGPHVLNGSYMNGSTGMGVLVHDNTPINPAAPYLSIIPYATYGIATFIRESVFLVDYQVTITS